MRARPMIWTCLVGLGLFLVAGEAAAVPASPAPIQLLNADGSTVWARMFGDEHLSWCEDLAGYALAFDPGAGSWNYATLGDDGRLVPSPRRTGEIDPAAHGFARHLRPGPAALATARALRATRVQPRALTGEVHNLVLLVRFANQNTRFAKEDFEPVFNGAEHSVNQYFLEASYGAFNLTSTIVGWIDLPQNDSYYCYNEVNYSGRPSMMVKHAVDVLNSQGFDFTPFDHDGDGTIDAIDIIHSGQGYENSGGQNDIHSHAGPTNVTTHDGITINFYHTEPEMQRDINRPTQIGAIVHETSHFFGLPDLYDYDFDSAGAGFWSVLALGCWGGPMYDGNYPVHPDAWAKAQMGWVTPVHVTTNQQGLVLHPAEQVGEALRIDAGLPANQYFLLENRQQTDFDAYLPGAGLIIYHVDENQWDNNNQDDFLVDVEQADGRRDLNLGLNPPFGDSTDPWPLSDKDAFTPVSTPNTLGYGKTTSPIFVSGIQRVGADLSLGVSVTAAITLAPASLAFSGFAGQPLVAAAVTLDAQSSGPLAYTATPLQDWIQATPATGSAPATVQVSVRTDDLAAGTYNGAVRFVAPGADNSPLELPVTLTVKDSCPDDPDKVDPGACGCGVPDTDSDQDGTADCDDACPQDPAKVAAGLCGCGVADIDSDQDGAVDCQDACPDDPAKTAAGQCGCLLPDIDSDGDGTADCQDQCYLDPLKTLPGKCDCGVAEDQCDEGCGCRSASPGPSGALFGLLLLVGLALSGRRGGR